MANKTTDKAAIQSSYRECCPTYPSVFRGLLLSGKTRQKTRESQYATAHANPIQPINHTFSPSKRAALPFLGGGQSSHSERIRKSGEFGSLKFIGN